MKHKPAFFFCTILIAFQCYSQTSDTITRFLNHNKEIITTDGGIEGVYISKLYKSPGDDGLWAETVYNNLPHKPIASCTHYKDSAKKEKQGKMETFYLTGEKQSETFYENNRLNGEKKYWNKQGQLFSLY